ncbi:hypothetical protein [Bacillus subtilis]|uniref:hypothetical protein n=1 Tax=Bacillus subtilis TaxID=1423 RepID=UPI0025CA2161|nr:hypothetical protein [Bacillus subtilis]MEC2297168.1 hypothetical protein [Bacillus subtilis]GLI90710.1 hypothetical protein ANABIO4_40620 [Bacillus subtilis]
MIKYKKALVLTLMAIMFLNLNYVEDVSAATTSSKASSSTSSSSARISSSSRNASVKLNKSAVNLSKSASNRASLSSSRSKLHDNKINSTQRMLAPNLLRKGNLKSTLNQKPVNRGFQNYYFPYWFIFGSHSYSHDQSQTIRNLGLKEKELTQPEETRYWLLIEDKNHKKHAVLVSKDQYKSVKKGDKVRVTNKNLINLNKH